MEQLKSFCRKGQNKKRCIENLFQRFKKTLLYDIRALIKLIFSLIIKHALHIIKSHNLKLTVYALHNIIHYYFRPITWY